MHDFKILQTQKLMVVLRCCNHLWWFDRVDANWNSELHCHCFCDVCRLHF